MNSSYSIEQYIIDRCMRSVQNKFDYVSHPQNLPLQLNGNSKKRIQPLNKHDFNQARGNLNQQSKSLLLKKLANNIHNFSSNKSVIPQPEQRHKSRPSSIKTFNNNKENYPGSGIQYLLKKSQNNKRNDHRQKAHFVQPVIVNSKISEKKHFQPQNESQVKDQIKRQTRHQQTAIIKLSQDIYSNPYRRETKQNNAKKIQSNNFFKCGFQLGYEEGKKKQVSDNKMIEMMGSQHVRRGQQIQKNRRQDWRISNVF